MENQKNISDYTWTVEIPSQYLGSWATAVSAGIAIYVITPGEGLGKIWSGLLCTYRDCTYSTAVADGKDKLLVTIPALSNAQCMFDISIDSKGQLVLVNAVSDGSSSGNTMMGYAGEGWSPGIKVS